MAENEISLERQDPAEEAKQGDTSKKDGVKAPLLIEFTITVSAIILVLVFLTVVGISLATGATLLDFVFRTSISILVLGGLLVTITRQISNAMRSGGTAKPSEEPAELEMPVTSEVQ